MRVRVCVRMRAAVCDVQCWQQVLLRLWVHGRAFRTVLECPFAGVPAAGQEVPRRDFGRPQLIRDEYIGDECPGASEHEYWPSMACRGCAL